MQIIQNRKYYFILSSVLIVASVAAVAVWGLKQGLDFTGGSLLEVEFGQERPSNEAVAAALEPVAGKTAVSPTGNTGLIIKMRHLDEDAHQSALKALVNLTKSQDKLELTEKRFESIGPTISSQLKRQAVVSIIFVSLAIIIYIAFVFRKVSRPVSSWKYGVAAVLALTHDIIIPVGVFAALGHYLGAEVDTLFVTALLTVMGFSVHDTIVVFDRIRENLIKFPRDTFEEVVNRSVNQTFTRSINTSLTVLIVLLAVLLFGGVTIKYFVLTLIVGVVVGTYSSIFIASPLLVVWQRLSKKI
jgi:preprotein translocase subunit SecF